jgi:acetyl esterase/lipase
VVYSKNGKTLDLYLPELPPDKTTKLPTIVFVHGGAYNSGSKETYCLLGEALRSEGFVVVIPSYSLYPDALVPQMLEEIHEAVLWTRTSLAYVLTTIHPILHALFRDLIDLNDLCICGHSVGGQLAAMTVINHPSLLKKFIGLAGVYDVQDHFGFEHQRCIEQASGLEPAMGLPFEPLLHCSDSIFRWCQSLRSIFSKPYREELGKTRVIGTFGVCLVPWTFCNRVCFLLAKLTCSSFQDEIVPQSQSVDFDNILQQKKLNSKLEVLQGCDHIDIVVGKFWSKCCEIVLC